MNDIKLNENKAFKNTELNEKWKMMKTKIIRKWQQLIFQNWNSSWAKAENHRKTLIFPFVAKIFQFSWKNVFFFFRFLFFQKIRIKLQFETQVLMKIDTFMVSILNFELLSILFPLFLMILRIEIFQNSKKIIYKSINFISPKVVLWIILRLKWFHLH